MFFDSGDCASTIAILSATTTGHSSILAAGVSGVPDNGKMDGGDEASPLRVFVRRSVCFQYGLDVGFSELVAGVVVERLKRSLFANHKAERKIGRVKDVS